MNTVFSAMNRLVLYYERGAVFQPSTPNLMYSTMVPQVFKHQRCRISAQLLHRLQILFFFIIGICKHSSILAMQCLQSSGLFTFFSTGKALKVANTPALPHVGRAKMMYCLTF